MTHLFGEKALGDELGLARLLRWSCVARSSRSYGRIEADQFIRNCAGVLVPGGHLAILMGDYCDREEGFVPLVYHTKRLCFEAGLKQECTDIIRFQHGNTSSRKSYRSSFIPGLHDVCTIVTKPAQHK